MDCHHRLDVIKPVQLFQGHYPSWELDLDPEKQQVQPPTQTAIIGSDSAILEEKEGA